MEQNKFTNQQLFSYAYLAVSFDKKQDVFKNYVALVEYYLAERHFRNRKIGFEVLHEGINELFGIQMPRATLRILLRLMQKDDKIKLIGGDVEILEDKIASNYISKRDNIEKDVEDLLIDFKDFLKEKGFALTVENVKEIFYSFLQNNSFVVSEIYSNKEVTLSSIEEYTENIVEYLTQLKTKDVKIYNTVLHLTMGAIRTSLLNLEPEKIKRIGDSQPIIEKVILDTNFLLRLLNLQGKIDCKIANETFNLLKNIGVDFLVHEKTVDELITSISNYLFQTDTVTSATRTIFENNKIGFSGFLAAETNGITRSILLQYRERSYSVKQIEELGCRIFDDTVNVNKVEVEELVKEKNRISYTSDNAIHDLTLIEWCKLLRKNKKNPIHSEKIWVLTNDAKLTSWNKQKCKYYGHACITESQISSYIWMQSGNTGVELNFAILALSTQNNMGIEQVINFQNAYVDYARKATTQELQQFALVFSCGDLTKEDFTDLNDNETISNLVAKKISDIEKEICEKENEVETKTRLLESQLKEKNTSIEETREKLVEENVQIKESLAKLSNENEVLLKHKKVLISAKNRLKTVGCFMLLALLLCAVGSFFLARLIIKDKVGDSNLINLISGISSIVFPIIIFIISTLIFGESKSFSELFTSLNIKFCRNSINKLFSSVDLQCKINIKDINTAIEQKNERLDNNIKEINKLGIERGKIEFAIRKIDGIIE